MIHSCLWFAFWVLVGSVCLSVGQSVGLLVVVGSVKGKLWRLTGWLCLWCDNNHVQRETDGWRLFLPAPFTLSTFNKYEAASPSVGLPAFLAACSFVQTWLTLSTLVNQWLTGPLIFVFKITCMEYRWGATLQLSFSLFWQVDYTNNDTKRQ